MKRCIIELPKFRVSKPGFDVDTAGLNGMLFHESFLFSQPYYFEFVSCPFAGGTDPLGADQTVQVTVPNVTATPIVLLFPVSSSQQNTFPTAKSEGVGNSQSGFSIENWSVQSSVISSTRIDIRFIRATGGIKSPWGTYMILMRDPSA